MKSSIINAASDHCDVTREQEDTEQWWNRLSLSTITGLKLQSHCEDMKTVLSSLTSSLITHSKCQYSRWYSRATVTNLSVLTLSNDVTAIVSWEVPRDLTVTMVMTLRSWTHPYSVVRWIMTTWPKMLELYFLYIGVPLTDVNNVSVLMFE